MLSEFTYNMDIISALDDEPNDVGGLSSTEIKAKFDEGGKAIKSFLNNTLKVEIDSHIANTSNPHAVTKAQVGLGNCDNTADIDKPVSAPLQAALDLKADKTNVLEKTNITAFTPTESYHPATKKYVDEVASQMALCQIPDGSISASKLDSSLKKGAANGIASLDSNGIVPLTQVNVSDVNVNDTIKSALGLSQDSQTLGNAMTKLNAAFGETGGTSDALTLQQPSFVLTDGATVRFKLHTVMKKGATLNVNATGAIRIVDALGKGQSAVAGSYCTVIYSSTTGNFILQGSGGGESNPFQSYSYLGVMGLVTMLRKVGNV